MKGKLKIIPFAMSILLIFTSCSQETEKKEDSVKLTSVETYEYPLGNIEKTLTYSGKATPINQINVMSKLTSKVLTTNKNVGDEVNAGDVLFSLDPEDLENQIKQLEAQVNMANTTVNSAQTTYNNITGGQYQAQILQQEAGISATQRQVDAAKLSLEQAQDGLALTESTYNSQKALYDSGIISQNDFNQIKNGYDQAKVGVEQAQIAYDNAVASLEQQKEAYEITKNQITSDSLESAEQGINQATASLNSAQLQLQLAKDTLNDLDVEAPISGVVSYKGVKEGEYASPSQVAYVITDLDQVLVEVKVSEKLINQIYVGEEVPVKFSALDDEVMGTVYEVNPVADQTSTYPIKILIDNPAHVIKPGMFAEITFVTESADNAIVVDRSTVLTNDGQDYVYTYVDGKAVLTPVETGIDNGEYVEITSGLTVDDQVIVTGQDFVSDGEEVNAKPKGE